MDRRAFLGALAGGLLAAPLAAEAQPAAKDRSNRLPLADTAGPPPATWRPFAKGCVTSVTSRAATS